MSMTAGQALMMKLATNATSVAVMNAPASVFKESLKNTGQGISLYGLKIVAGDKKDWLFVDLQSVTEENPYGNPLIVSPDDGSLTPMSFESEAAAEDYNTLNHLKYTYDDGTVSTFSAKGLVIYTPGSEKNNDKMADLLAEPCKIKNDQTWSLDPKRPPTSMELKQVIESTILNS